MLRGAGEHFSSGGDIKGFRGDARARQQAGLERRVAPARCSKPVIAAGRGYCFGVGFELSLAPAGHGDDVYALPEQKLGQIPGSGGSARLQKMVGITRTRTS